MSGISGADDQGDVSPVFPTEIQSLGTENEWIELINTGDTPVNLFDYAVSPEGSSRSRGRPSTYFAGYENLGTFGTPAEMNDQIYYLNAEDMYVIRYLQNGSHSFYMYKMTENNTYGTYYHIEKKFRSSTFWWDDEDKIFLNEDEKDQLHLAELEDHIYQITFPNEWFIRYQYIGLNTGDDHKYEDNQPLYDHEPDGMYLTIDLGDMDSNQESRELAQYWQDEFEIAVKSSSLESLYHAIDLEEGRYLNLTDDDDGTLLTRINLSASSGFWDFPYHSNFGVLFVNDNHPETLRYLSRRTGDFVPSGDEYTMEVDLTDTDLYDHYSASECFQENIKILGNITVDFSREWMQSQITVLNLSGPILTDTVFVNKNTGAIVSGPDSDIVEITLDLQEDDFSWLFPMGSTYRDYTTAGAPVRNLDHLIVVEDIGADPEGHKNDLIANGILYIWNVTRNEVVGGPLGWGTSGPGPECMDGWTSQAYFSGSFYHLSTWTLGDPTPGTDNKVPAPVFRDGPVILNEINPVFIELFNRDSVTWNVSGWKLTGEGNSLILSGEIAPGDHKVIPETEFHIPFTPAVGGRISLFDDSGVLQSSIGYQTDVPSDLYSYCQRHIDGFGPDHTYNDSMLQPWMNGVPGTQRNADWDIGTERTPGTANYNDFTILQIGEDDSHYGLVEDLSLFNESWAPGIVGTTSLDGVFPDIWDMMFVVTEVSPGDMEILENYVLSGGCLYLEQLSWNGSHHTDFLDRFNIDVLSLLDDPPGLLTGNKPLTEGMVLDYGGNATNTFTVDDNVTALWEAGGEVFTVLLREKNDTPVEGRRRMVLSSVKYHDLSKGEPDGDEPYNYTGRIIHHFLVNDIPVAHILSISPDLTYFGDSVRFNGTCIGGISASSYEWSSSLQGVLSSDQVFQSDSIMVGTHTILLRAMNEHGVWGGSVSDILVIHERPRAFIDLVQPDPAVEHTPILLNGHGIDDNGIAGFAWSSSIDGQLGNNATVRTSSLSVGTHTISLKVMDEHFAWSGEVSTSLIVHERPIARIIYIDHITSLDHYEVTFHGEGTDDGNIIRHVWNSSLMGEFYNGTPSEITIINFPPGNHIITFMVQDDLGVWSERDNSNLILIVIEKDGGSSNNTSANLHPVVFITSPENGSEIHDTIIIEGIAYDYDGTIMKVELRIGKGNWTAVRGTDQWEYTWSMDDIPSGTYRIEVRGYDGRNYSKLTGITVIVEKDNDEPRRTSYTIIISGVIIASSLALVGMAFFRENFRYVVLSFLALPLYSKIEKDDVLYQPNRREIFSNIARHPGLNFTQLTKQCNFGYGTLVHHLRVLEREEFIRSKKHMGKKLFFPKENGHSYHPSSSEFLLSPVQLRTLNFLKNHGPKTRMEIERNLVVKSSTLTYSLRRLRKWGLVVRTKTGKQVTYHMAARK